MVERFTTRKRRFGQDITVVPASDFDALVKERDALAEEVGQWKNAAFLSDCEAQSGLLDEMTAKAAALAEEVGRLKMAAERVVWFDWSDNDPDAVSAIEDLRALLEAKESSDAQG